MTLAVEGTLGPALIADIGATNARFAFIDAEGRERSATLACAGHPTLENAIAAFLTAIDAPTPPSQAAFAVAGPVTGDQIALTNLPWRFSVSGLRASFGLRRLEVINDFTAVALALPWLPPHHLRPVGPGCAAPAAPLAVLGPGSGLGVSGLIPTGAGWMALSGEGGHVTLAPADDHESAVLALLRRHGHVSAESVLSGPGLVNLDRALAARDGHSLPSRSAAEVVAAALAGRCPRASEVLALFAAFLGTVAGNLALTLGARGGVFIAGGIVPRLGDYLDRSAFRQRFGEKGLQSRYLANIPTSVIIHPTPAFFGLRALLSAPTPQP
jgi:glucokinase